MESDKKYHEFEFRAKSRSHLFQTVSAKKKYVVLILELIWTLAEWNRLIYAPL